MLLWMERDLEMDMNPLSHLLPRQSCKMLEMTTVALNPTGPTWFSEPLGEEWGSNPPAVPRGHGPFPGESSFYFRGEKLS